MQCSARALGRALAAPSAMGAGARSAGQWLPAAASCWHPLLRCVPCPASARPGTGTRAASSAASAAGGEQCRERCAKHLCCSRAPRAGCLCAVRARCVREAFRRRAADAPPRAGSGAFPARRRRRRGSRARSGACGRRMQTWVPFLSGSMPRSRPATRRAGSVPALACPVSRLPSPGRCACAPLAGGSLTA